MGDDCKVTTRRSEDSSPSSSPTVGARRIKDLEDPRIVEVPGEERESPLRSRPESGEPSEGLSKISDDKRVVQSDLPEGEADASECPPIVGVSRERPTALGGFPFSETKLRPDAPPFTPESLARSGPIAAAAAARHPGGGISDSVCGEPSFVQRPQIDDSCFVSVDLRSPDEDAMVPMAPPKPKQRNLVKALINSGPNAGIRDSRDPLKDPGLKPFSLTSTPRLKRSPPKIDLSVDSLHADVEMNETVAVATESGANEPEIRETGPETGEPRVVRGHWRILRAAFVIGNRIQIAVFIASVVLCVVIVVYVFV